MAINISRSLRMAVSLATLSGITVFSGLAFAEPAASIYGESYQKVESVISQQAQVVMYRGLDAGKEAAHVYIDGQLQSALMPGGYTRFCVPAGEHSLESYIGDAPQYAGKRNPQSYAKLDGGQTYVLEAPLNGGTPIVHTGADAERSLQGMRRQIHVISRSASVVPCQTQTKLTLRSDVLFAFGKSRYQDLTVEGRAMLGQAVQDIKEKSSNISSIEVVGHADPIGSAEANQRLSLRRAQTIRTVLLEEGIDGQLVQASGRGSSEPVVQCDNSARNSRVSCNAPNRRVELIIK